MKSVGCHSDEFASNKLKMVIQIEGYSELETIIIFSYQEFGKTGSRRVRILSSLSESLDNE
jgi:hypothetical protein